MKQTLLSLLAGVICGVIFFVSKLPLPAPPVFSGIAGIFGIYASAKITFMLKEKILSTKNKED